MKNLSLDWFQNPKLHAAVITVLILMVSCSLANKPIDSFVVCMLVVNTYNVMLSYETLKRNDRNKNPALRENDWRVLDDTVILKHTIFFSSACFFFSFSSLPTHSLLQGTILAIYFVLSIMYCLVRSTPLLSICFMAASMAVLCLFPVAQDSATFEALFRFFFAVLFIMFGRELIKDAVATMDSSYSIGDVFTLITGCITIFLGLGFSSAFFYDYQRIPSIVIFCLGFFSVIASCVMFVGFSKLKRTGLIFLNGGIIVMLIGIMFSRFLDGFEHFVYLFNQTINWLNQMFDQTAHWLNHILF